MSADDRQARLLGEPSGDSVSIDTSGRVIRPALALPAALANEGRVHIGEDGVRMQLVDPANVGLIHMQIYPAAFDAYALDAADDITVGVDLDALTSGLTNARKGRRTDDPVSLDIDDTRITIQIEREYNQTTVRYGDELLTIDPDSIREEPDLPDLDLPATAGAIDVSAFADAIEHIATGDDHMTVRERDGDLLLTGGSDEDSPSPYSSAVEIADVVDCPEDDAPVARYSIDYVKDMASALKTGLIDEVTLTWGDEYPYLLDFERREDDTVLYDGQYMLAPRIGGEQS